MAASWWLDKLFHAAIIYHYLGGRNLSFFLIHHALIKTLINQIKLYFIVTTDAV